MAGLEEKYLIARYNNDRYSIFHCFSLYEFPLKTSVEVMTPFIMER